MDRSDIEKNFLKEISAKGRSREGVTKSDSAKRTLTFDAELQKKHASSLVQEKFTVPSRPRKDLKAKEKRNRTTSAEPKV